MYITNHLVNDRAEMREIFDRITFHQRVYAPDEEELFFCVMDEDKVVGCATLLDASPASAVLEKVVLLAEYAGAEIERGLLSYIVFELEAMGKEELVLGVEGLGEGSGVLSWISGLRVEDRGGKKVLRLKAALSMARAG